MPTTEKFRGSFLGIGLWLYFSVLASPSGGDYRLSGDVVDPNGAVIANAHVVVHGDLSARDLPRPADAVATSDKVGRFDVIAEGAGFYDVCVMADAFEPQCRKVYVSKRAITLHFRLKADAEVLKRLGGVEVFR